MTGLGDVFRLLTDQGFKPAPAKLPRRAFLGNLHCARGSVAVRLTIEDWDFFSYPEITLIDRPAFLPHLMPHCDVQGNLCYFAPRSITLDRYDPEVAIKQCLTQAKHVLDCISLDPEYRSADIQLEFQAHWNYGQTKSPLPVLLGDIDPKEGVADYFILEGIARKHFLITGTIEQASQLSKAIGATMKVSRYKCWLMHTNKRPVVPDHMPNTVKELMVWLRSWDIGLSATMQKVLGEKEYLKYKFITFAIQTPNGWIGFGFDLNQIKRLGYARSPKQYRDYLHKAGGSQLIFRVAIEELGSRFVHSRNLSFPDLHNKRVTVVGCGAIGSFLGNALARLGAGAGKLGMLTLIDSDRLGAENLGRHTLGYPALNRPKSEAMCQDLEKQFPFSRFEAVVGDVRTYPRLFATDLLIDATGEESVNEYLNHQALQRHKKVPVLYVWIKGNGEAVQALWVDEDSDACYRCLLIPNEKKHREPRYRLLKGEVEQRTDGCRAYTPYAVAAPMEAAALASDMVCDWLHGSVSPRFRTRSRENADVYKLKNQDLSRMAGCPACDPQ